MNKAEELREILKKRPTDEPQRLLQQFMDKAVELLKKSRNRESREISGIIIPYKIDTLRFSEMCIYSRGDKIGNKYKKLFFSPDTKKSFETLDGLVEEEPIDIKDDVYILAKELVKEGFEVEFVYKTDNWGAWKLSKLIAYF